MRFRMWFFSVFAILSFGWICYGISVTSSVAEEIAKTPLPTSEYLSQEDVAAVRGLGTAIGGGLGLAFFACTGLPLAVLFSLLAWRNQVGYRNEKRHQEQIDVYKQQVGALNQAALAQTAQAQIQFANMQQPVASQAIPAQVDSSALRAQFDAAKALITAKKYAEARALLKTINHPTAADWLAKLDNMESKS